MYTGIYIRLLLNSRESKIKLRIVSVMSYICYTLRTYTPAWLVVSMIKTILFKSADQLKKELNNLL